MDILMDYIDKTFGRGGYLAQCQEGYEVREGQLALSRKVRQAMQHGRTLLAEAPCGSGKGFAYAVPAIEQVKDKRKTVIVTANIALQAQLMEKDFPVLAEALPDKFSVALLKGRNNFVCPRKIDQVELTRKIMGYDNKAYDNYGLDDEHGQMMRAALAWAEVTPSGDREEPGFPSGADGIWHLISVGQDDCIGRGCPHEQQGKCWANNHRRNAIKANIIVTNYHLLFAHAMIFARNRSGGILPGFHNLVMDEGHEAARIARDFFGARISFLRFKRIAEMLKHELKINSKALLDQGRWLMRAVGACADTMEYRAKQRLDKADIIDVEDVVLALRTAAKDASSIADEICPEQGVYGGLDDESKEIYHKAEMIERNAQALANDVNEVFHEPLDDKVYWIQIEKRRPIRVESRHLDVAATFRQQVFPLAKSVTLTSATLTTMGTFDLVRSELGVPKKAMEFVADSPFDFNASTRLVVADKKRLAPASQNRDAYNAAVLPLYKEILDLWPGRVLSLFTAITDLDWMHEKLDGYRGRTFYKQGEFPRPQLTEWFRDDPGSVLMGVDSFWTGVDVPGPKAIIIHKLPFPYQDVVLRAIAARMTKDEWFQGRYYPWMIMKLRQGIGRLLRRTGDYGFVVCMDRRITDKWAYADYIRRSLPFTGFIRSDELYRLQPFLQTYADDQAIAV
jgi:ATP-dependent DNA helicase DinG